MRFLLPFVAALLLAPAAEASLIEPIQGDIRPGHLLVSGPRLDEELSSKELQSAGTSLSEEIVSDKTWLVRLNPGVSLAEARSDLLGEDGVRYVEYDFRVEATALPPLTEPVPSDTSFGELWGLQNTGQSYISDGQVVNGTPGADIKARYAWQLEKGLAGDVVVGVADTGIDLQHSDLDGNIWQNPGEVAGNGIDDDSNGKVDDVRGWNFIGVSEVNPGNANVDDDHYHGTHVAGTIAAESNNSKGVTGVSWGARLAPLKVLDSNGGGYTSDVIASAEYAGQMGMEVYNASLGGFGDPSGAFLDTLQRYPNTLYVFAAGNNGKDLKTEPYGFYPCAYESSNVICVGASTTSDGKASFSNYGVTEVDLAAPGQFILSTIPRNYQSTANQDQYNYRSGTSMATPQVSGVAALLRQHRPLGLASDYRDIILHTVKKVDAWTGKSVTGGILDAYAALEEVRSRNPGAAPPAVSISSPRPEWVLTKDPSWQFAVVRNQGAPTCSLALEGGGTTNGPCSSSVFHQAVNLQEGGRYTFTVEATNAYGTGSASHTFRIDTLAPAAPTFSERPPAISSSTLASWRITGESGATFACKTSGVWVSCNGASAPGEARHSVSGLSDGTYQFAARQTDPAGHVSPEQTMTWVVDTVAPAAPTITSQPAAWTTSSSASVSFASSFDTECSFNGSSYSPCSSPWTTSGLLEGTHTFRVRQVDLAGNASQPAEAVWRVDSTPPTNPSISGPSGTTAFRNVTFSIEGEEGATYRCSLDSVTLADCSNSMSYENLSDGSHVFRARQVDRAGNLSAEATRTINVSDSGTEIIWDSLPQEYSQNRSPRFTWSLSAAVWQTRCAVSPVNTTPVWRNCTGAEEDQIFNLADGSYVFRVRIEDSVGSWLTRSHSFYVDNTAPQLSLGGASGNQSSRSATWNWAVSEDSTFLCSLNDQPETSCSSPFTVSGLSDGTYAFRVRATDRAGNIAVANRSIAVDATPPARPTLELLSGGSPQAEVRITAEGGTSLFCRLGSEAWSACSSPWRRTVVDGTSVVLEVRAQDTAGNFSEIATLQWQTGLPLPSLRGPDSAGRIFLEGAPEGAEYLCAFGNENLRVCSSVLAPRFTNGSYPYRLQVRQGSRTSQEVRGSIEVTGAPAPPGGPVGISINEGNLYTSSNQVRVSVVWPAGARSMIIASDGSFQGERRSLSEKSAWTIPLSGSERLPRTVYVRFLGPGDEIMYSGNDDIILDTLPPRISGISGQERDKVYLVQFRASDAVSGVFQAAITYQKARPEPGQKGTVRNLGKSLSLQGRGNSPRWARVSDRAGNWSAWQRVR